MAYRKVARSADVPPGEVRLFVLDGNPVIIANHGHRFFALSGLCPHQNMSLAGAHLWDGLVTCPWHNYQYDIVTGENYFPKSVYPADLREHVLPLATYPAKIRGDEIWVDLDERGKEPSGSSASPFGGEKPAGRLHAK